MQSEFKWELRSFPFFLLPYGFPDICYIQFDTRSLKCDICFANFTAAVWLNQPSLLQRYWGGGEKQHERGRSLRSQPHAETKHNKIPRRDEQKNMARFNQPETKGKLKGFFSPPSYDR